jgi:hypothetical protein
MDPGLRRDVVFGLQDGFRPLSCRRKKARCARASNLVFFYDMRRCRHRATFLFLKSATNGRLPVANVW